MTIYPARRVKWTLMCGRPGPDGRPICQGIVGTIGMTREGETAAPPPGYVEGPPGIWRPSRRARDKMAFGHPPGLRRPLHTPTGSAVPVHPTPPLWRAECPHCGRLTEVTASLLS